MELTPTQDRLRALLADPRHATLRGYLESRTRLWERPAEIVFAPPPPTTTTGWRPDAPFVVVTDDVVFDGNLITGPDHDEGGTLILLGGLRVRNVLARADTLTLCSGAVVVAGLMFVATPDSTFVTAGALDARVVYSGHGDGWLTALGPARVEVLDDYIEGPDDDVEVTATNPTARARDVVVDALADDDGGLDREAALAVFSTSTSLTR